MESMSLRSYPTSNERLAAMIAHGGALFAWTLAPLVVYLLSDQARHVTGQVYTSVGPKIAVWNQPREVRAVYADGRWTPEAIAARLDSTVGQERMPLLDQLEAYRKAAEAKAAAEAGAGS